MHELTDLDGGQEEGTGIDRAAVAQGDDDLLMGGRPLPRGLGGRGDCWDNAPKESFWSTIKTELIHHENYATREQARQSIFEYIEMFYNRTRLHSSLGYRSPEAFEAGLT